MNLKKTRVSLTTGYKIFALLSTMIILFILGKQLHDKLHFVRSHQKLFYSIEASKVQLALNDSLSYVESFSIFIADKIANLDHLSPHAISSLLGYKSKSYISTNDILTSTLVEFITPTGEIIVSTNLSTPSGNNLTSEKPYRNWMNNARLIPWKLYLDKVALGLTNGPYAIPTSLGVTSYKDDKFLGIISAGIDAHKLNEKIKEYLNSNYTDYLILNHNLDPIAFSKKFMTLGNLGHLKSLAENLTETEGDLNRDFMVNDVHFRYYKKDQNYSYIILVGISDNAEFHMLLDSILEHFNTSLFMLMIFSIILYFFSKMMLTPIKLLSHNALAIAKGEKLQYTPNINTEDAQYLAYALTMVQESLAREKEVQAELQQANTSLEARVKERTVELEKALTANIDFVNNMSHEVRTPVHGINAISRGLVDNWDTLDQKTAQNLATKIASNSQRLLSLVNNMLDISQTQFSEMHFNFQKIRINELIDSMIEECKNLYLYDKSIDIVFNKESDLELFIDPERITQVLRNLLSNAIKVTKFGTITIALKQKEHLVVISVSDEGIGIPEKELNSIFNSFSQSSRTKGKIGGAGLGLTISKQIVEVHGGKIWAENNSNSKGASFIFTLPMPTNLPASLKQTISNAANFVTTKANLMVIDDEDTCLLSVSMIAYNTNYKLFSYEHPIEAVQWLQNNPSTIDVILVDIMMPEMTGIEFLQILKSDPKLKHIPVIIQSGTSDDTKFTEAYQNGAVDLIRKPYTAETFILAVEKVLQGKKKPKTIS